MKEIFENTRALSENSEQESSAARERLGGVVWQEKLPEREVGMTRLSRIEGSLMSLN